MPFPSARRVLCMAACLWPGAAPAQEAVRFGAWHAFCTPVAGCVMGVASGEGDMLAFVEPSNGDDHMVLLLADPVEEGAELAVAFDDDSPALRIDAATGWRLVDSAAGPAVRIAPGVADRLAGSLLRRDRMTVGYRTVTNIMRRTVFSLNGYADTRGYTDDG